MAATQILANPFALLVCPESVCQAVARSERLSHLRRRVCRPLDKPLIPLKSGAASGQLRAAA